jgi:ATP:corrinoid adenosyltransferase
MNSGETATDARNFDVDIDAVQQRAADFFLVASDGHGGTTVFFDGVAVEAAGTGMQVGVVSFV